MAKFITGKELEKAVYDIIWDAEHKLLIVSPYIRLDLYFQKLFEKHINNPNLHLIVVFGKNEGRASKSLSRSDFDFFKNFLNVSVVYVPNLHAKYYGNEKKGVISSINLYDYSFINNIEFGVYSEAKFISGIEATDKDAWNTCMDIADENEAVFIKRPVYSKNLLSSIIGKNYVKSDTLHDVTDRFYSTYRTNKVQDSKKLDDFPLEIIMGSAHLSRPTREEVENKPSGFCIHTGVKITFNPDKPYCEEAYKIWAKYENPNYPENFCHKTGKPSNGKTSMKRPVLFAY